MDKNKGYTLGLYEKALPSALSFEEKLHVTRECGFDRLEISIDESDQRLSRLDWSTSERKALSEASRREGVPIRTMCLSGHRKYPLGSTDAAVRARSMDIMCKAVDLSADIGVTVIQLAGYDVYYEKSSTETERLFSANLRIAAEYAAQRGIVLAFETMETAFMDTVGKAMHYVNEINSPWLGVYPDIGNLQNASSVYGHDIIEDFEKGSGHIFAVHLKETKPGIYRDMRFGTDGHTQYDRFISSAVGMGVRMFTCEFWYKDGQDYYAETRRASLFAREKIEAALISKRR